MAKTDRWIPVDPAVRAGLYQMLEQVPDHFRLRVYAGEFEHRDIWHEYLNAQSWIEGDPSFRRRQQLDREELRWKSFIDSRERHHALCTPTDAERYAQELTEAYNLNQQTASDYWSAVERFYRWMFHHAEYPHRYHPFVMAAARYNMSNKLWREAVDR